MRRVVNIAAVVFLVILALLVTAGLLFTPRLVSFSPGDGEVRLPAQVELRLTFSTEMDHASVLSRLQLSPPVQGEYLWEQATLVFRPAQSWPAGETIQVTLAPGARRGDFIPLWTLRETAFQFTITTPAILYLYPSTPPADLYELNPLGGVQKRLTTVPGGVLDFSASPDGVSVYYSTRSGAIEQLNRISGESQVVVACPEAACRAPRLSADGRYLAYERTSNAAEPVAYPQVWLQPLPEGEPFPADPQSPYSRTPDWSADGWLSYYDPGKAGFVAFNPDSGEQQFFPNETGEPGDWSPQAPHFIAPEILLIENGYLIPGGDLAPLPSSHLMRFERGNENRQDLSIADVYEDVAPAVSPDGTLLAFGRKYLDPQRWTPGRQLWVMELATQVSRQLTDEPYFNHSAIGWSPDGAQLVYLRSNQSDLTELPEIWLIDLEGVNPIQLVKGGFAPVWVP